FLLIARPRRQTNAARREERQRDILLGQFAPQILQRRFIGGRICHAEFGGQRRRQVRMQAPVEGAKRAKPVRPASLIQNSKRDGSIRFGWEVFKKIKSQWNVMLADEIPAAQLAVVN